MAKTKAKEVLHRMRYQTADGSLVVNREISDDMWPTYQKDAEFRDSMLKHESRTKGVKVLSWSIVGNDFVAIVAWL